MKTSEQPLLQDFQIEGVQHISPTDALRALLNKEAVMIDVRELNEVKLESVPLERVLNHPMSVIAERLPYIAKNQNIITACPGGVRSTRIAFLLMQNGYERVASLDGGLNTWKAMGFPFENNLSHGGCGCHSGTQINANRPSAPLKNEHKSSDFKNLKPLS